MHRLANGITTICLTATLAIAGDSDVTKTPRTKRQSNPALAKIEDVPSLPRVLLIGDSISIGYTLPVRKMMLGKANVHRPPTNCGPTTRGIAQIDEWLDNGQWDVIHFNWGLHDLKYVGPDGKSLADPKAAGSRKQVPIDEYEANMRKLVARMKTTGARLIWRSTTPVPEGAKGRVAGDSARYNAVAEKIMGEHGVMIDDHFSFSLPKLKELQRPANVHFTGEGYLELAKKAVAAISGALAE